MIVGQGPTALAVGAGGGGLDSFTLIYPFSPLSPSLRWGGRVVRRCWVNFQCRGVLLIWITVGQGLIVLAVGAGGGCLDIFSLIYRFSFLSPSLWETARYRLKYCLKGPLSPKQPTNQPTLRETARYRLKYCLKGPLNPKTTNQIFFRRFWRPNQVRPRRFCTITLIPDASRCCPAHLDSDGMLSPNVYIG